MSYEIYINNKKDSKVDVYLDNEDPKRNPSFPPRWLVFGTGDKAAKYKQYLEDSFSKHNQLLNFLAHIHKLGKEKGNVNLICKSRFKVFMPQAIRDFLVKNKETLDMMLPYIFPDAGYKAKEGDDSAQDIKPMVRNQLPPEDMAIIQRLIQEDQEKERQKQQVSSEENQDEKSQ